MLHVRSADICCNIQFNLRKTQCMDATQPLPGISGADLLGICRAVAAKHNDPDLEDAAQDSAVAILQSAAKFDPKKSKASTFSWNVARRRMIDRYRSRQTYAARNNQPLDGHESEDGCKFSDDPLLMADRARAAADEVFGDARGRGREHLLAALAATLILQEELRETGRGMVMRLRGWPELRARLGLIRTPDRVTLWRGRIAIKRWLRRQRANSRQS